MNTPPSKSEMCGLPQIAIVGIPSPSNTDFVRVPTDEYLALQKEVESLRGELKMVRVGFEETKLEVKRLLDERTDLTQWFEHRHVYGTFTIEQRDAMTPRQMADYCYERKAERLEVAHEALKKAKVALESFDRSKIDIMGMIYEESFYGKRAAALEAIKGCGL